MSNPTTPSQQPQNIGPGIRPRKKNEPPNQPPEVKEVETKGVAFEDWLGIVYAIDLLPDNELISIYESARYKGFNREVVLKKMFQILKEPKLVVEAVIICSLRGPQAAQHIILSNQRTLLQMGVPGSGGQGQDTLTCNKITSSTADLAAFYLKKLRVNKRLPSHPLPGWLQFPSAGSINLPNILREQHIDFHKIFSKLIGGVFNEQIYSTMMANAYLDNNLHLFDNI